jgi:hypothetical protein
MSSHHAGPAFRNLKNLLLYYSSLDHGILNMGSDNHGPRTPFFVQTSLRFYQRQRNLFLFLIGIALIAVAVVFTLPRLPPPELVLADSFASNEYHHLPAQCEKVAADFNRCQVTSNQTVVFACHRKWCNHWGHCEPCMGLGDRARFLFSGLAEASKHCLHIQLDYPVSDIALLNSAIYRDPAGWWGELFHFRSYHAEHSKLALPPRDEITFSHFQSTNGVHDYDACLFHLLFQPSDSLRRDVNRHNAAIGESSIGIHFRAGDVAAFGIQNNDWRIGHGYANQLDAAIATMLKCADRLAAKLFPDRQQEQVTYFLATDSSDVKDMVSQNASAWSSHPIYMTSVQPQFYMRAVSGDRDAWMELYLLAARQGLVANALPSGYEGRSKYQYSLFAKFAKKIGFLSDDKFIACALDNDSGKKL